MSMNKGISPLTKASTYAIVRELERRSLNTGKVTCVKREDVYVITVEESEVKI